MSRTLLLAVITIALIAAASIGCAAKPSEKSEAAPESEKTIVAEKISAETAKKMIDAGSVTIVDVRSADEYAQGHIPGAVLAPLNELPSGAETLFPDKDAVLLVYCRSGNRSAQAVSLLNQLGYTRLYDFGGIIDWPYEIVN